MKSFKDSLDYKNLIERRLSGGKNIEIIMNSLPKVTLKSPERTKYKPSNYYFRSRLEDDKKCNYINKRSSSLNITNIKLNESVQDIESYKDNMGK